MEDGGGAGGVERADRTDGANDMDRTDRTDDLERDVRYAVGLDLGDGESSLCWLPTAGRGQAQVHTRGTEGVSIVTALGRVPEQDLGHRVVIGEDAVLARNCVHFSVNFKNRHGHTDLQVVQFAQVFLTEFFAAHPEVREDCVLYVGHPAGWDRASVRTYQRQLGAVEVPVRLVAESQSALVHVRDRRAERRDTSGLDRVLVVDVGSSTTDFTAVEDLIPRNLPVGAELGCREIDAALAAILRADFADTPEFTEALARDGGPDMLLLVCRRAKEAQFTRQDLKLQDMKEGCTDELVALVTLSVERLRGVDVRERVVRAPGGWADRFAATLTEVRGHLGPPGPDLVVLTGGGSRMPVVRELCAAAFPEATVENDEEPSLSVTRGLASIGRHSVNVARFRRDILALGDHPAFEEAIRAGLLTAFDQAKATLLAHLLERAEREDAEGEQNLDALIRELTGMDRVLADLRRTLEKSLIPLVLGICRSYGIRDDQFTLDIALPEIIGTTISRRIRALWIMLRGSQSVLATATRVPQVGMMFLKRLLRGGVTPAKVGAAAATAAVVVALPKGAELGARRLIRTTLHHAALDPAEVNRLVTDVAERIAEQMDQRAQEVERFLV
ncbi:Hsp70 family protein [Streptomyces sp. NPDC017940]|uniref:Hsp70 family protein n=1 Tax=Streptomyces sp. NPDC017940 TaxID=3365017 RepID=UPI0037B20064